MRYVLCFVFFCFFLGISSRVKLPSIYRPLSPDKVLREQPPVRPAATGAMLPLDCSELPGQILPAEAPIILSQPRTGKADYYELTWRPRHERGIPVLEYMVKYRKVLHSLLKHTNRNDIISNMFTVFFCNSPICLSLSGGRPSSRLDLQQYLRLSP